MNCSITITDEANVLAEAGRLFNFEYSNDDVDVVSPVSVASTR